MSYGSSRVPSQVSNLIKMVTGAFYSDLHIQIIDLILRMGYISEYTISKELEIKVEKVKLVTNSLHNENFIKFEDRIFKKQKQDASRGKKKNNRKIYKIRFWFIDPNYFIWSLKERLKKIFSPPKKNFLTKSETMFKCSRKICGKNFSLNEIARIPFDHRTGILTCDNFLNQKVICGRELIEIRNFNTSWNTFEDSNGGGKKIEEIKPIIQNLLFSSKVLKFPGFF